MKVLQLCSKPPLPAIDGGCKAMNVITQGLLENKIEVKVLTISTHKHPFLLNQLSDNYIKATGIESVFIDTRVKLLEAFKNLFSTNSYNVSRFYNAEFEDLIVTNLANEQYDVVFLEGLSVLPYLNAIQNNSQAKIIYRAHNIEFEIWERNAVASTNPLKKWYLNLLANRLKTYEVSILNKIDGIAAITDKDKEQLIQLGCQKPIETIPFGVDLKEYQSTKVEHKFSLFHIGSMEWLPNQEAIKWFLEKVLPNVDVPFYLAGKNMSAWFLQKKQKNLFVVGEVESAVDFINGHQVMIVPLFSGSGMRIKIVEAMALGKVIIATAIAVEGINCQHQENILIANTAQEYITAINWCFDNPELADELSKNAKKMIALHYDNTVIVNNLVAFFKK